MNLLVLNGEKGSNQPRTPQLPDLKKTHSNTQIYILCNASFSCDMLKENKKRVYLEDYG